MSLMQNRQFRNTVLKVLVKLYMGLSTPDYISVCQCFIFLDDSQAVAEILEKMVKGSEVCVKTINVIEDIVHERILN